MGKQEVLRAIREAETEAKETIANAESLASEIITKVFDNQDLHTRAAISSNSLQLGVAVEVDAIFEIN